MLAASFYALLWLPWSSRFIFLLSLLEADFGMYFLIWLFNVKEKISMHLLLLVHLNQFLNPVNSDWLAN